MNKIKTILKQFETIWDYIFTLVATLEAILIIREFGSGIQDKQLSIANATLIFLYLCVLVSVIFIRFKIVKNSKLGKRVSSILLIILVIIPLVLLIKNDKEPIVLSSPQILKTALNDPILILVANFLGPEPEIYQVSEEVIDNLQQIFSEYPDFEIRPTAETITMQEGSQKAREVGSNSNADMVIWGRYSVVGDSAHATIHIENLNPISKYALGLNEVHTKFSDVTEIQQFQFQRELSNDLTTIALFIAGVTHFDQQNYEEAIQYLNNSLTVGKWPADEKDLAAVHYYLGNSYLALGDNQRARQALLKAYKIDPTVSDTPNSLGIAYLRDENYHKALDYFKEASTLEPQVASYHRNIGSVYMQLNDIDQAEAAINKAIDLEPTSVDYYYLSLIYTEAGNDIYARRFANKAIELESTAYFAYLARGIVFMNEDRFEEALNDFIRASDLKSDEPAIFYYMGKTYARTGKCKEAITSFEKTISLEPLFTAGPVFRTPVGGYVAQGPDDQQAIVCYLSIVESEKRHLKPLVREILAQFGISG